MFDTLGSIRLVDTGEFLFKGGRQGRRGLPLFEGVVSIPPEQQIEMAVILRRRGEREFMRVGSVDFYFYFKESGRCNFVVNDRMAQKLSVFPMGQAEQWHFRRMILYSLFQQTVSLYLEGNVILKSSEDRRVEINGVEVPESECFRLSEALLVGSYYQYPEAQVVVSLMGYGISNYYLSSSNSYKLQVLFEVASLFFSPSEFVLKERRTQ